MIDASKKATFRVAKQEELVAASEGKGERALVLVPQDNTHFCRTYTLLMLACMYPRRSIQSSRPAFEGKSLFEHSHSRRAVELSKSESLGRKEM
jgi:hypothetical protein